MQRRLDVNLALGLLRAKVKTVDLPRRAGHRRDQWMDLMTHEGSLMARPEKRQPAALRQTKQTHQSKGHAQVDQRGDTK